MHATHQQEHEFIRAIAPRTLLAKALKWIRENLKPENVFEEYQLRIWAREHGMADETPAKHTHWHEDHRTPE